MTDRMDTIQALRAVAALLVVVFHLHAAAMAEVGTSGPFAFFQRGEIGVDLFFVLSGFIITWSALAKPGLTTRSFLTARFWRIVPPYWAALALYLLAFVGLAVATGDVSRLPDGLELVTAILLLPVPDHIVIVAWSLTLEILFYALFALTWFRGGQKVFVCALASWAVAALVAEQTGHSNILGLVLHPSVPEFLLGAVVAWALSRNGPRLPLLALSAGFGFVAIGVTGALDDLEAQVGRTVIYGVPAALAIYGAAGCRWSMPPWVLVLGEASYLLYLLHLLVFYGVGRGIEMLTGFNVYTSPLASLGMLFVATLVSVATHVWAEKPYQRWYRSLRGSNAKPGYSALTPAR